MYKIIHTNPSTKKKLYFTNTYCWTNERGSQDTMLLTTLSSAQAMAGFLVRALVGDESFKNISCSE